MARPVCIRKPLAPRRSGRAFGYTTINMKERPTKACDECGSLYFLETSQMDALCPECAHLLYGYPACDHAFLAGRCTKCHWDGSVSDYCRKLKREGAK